MKLTNIHTAIVTLVCLFMIHLSAHAAPGDLDSTFDMDGKLATSLGAQDFARSVAIQADGKIVVAGYTEDATLDISLVRYNPDGSLDTNFGMGGKVLWVQAGHQQAHSVMILPDGKILAIGSDLLQLAAYRFNSDGTPDMTFDGDGKISHVIGLESVGHDAVRQADGKIVIAGYVQFVNESWRFTVFRLNADGSLDTSFNSIGYTPVLFGGTRAYAVALQSDGKIIAAGRDTGGNNHGYWGRFGTDGILEGGVSALVQGEVQFNDVAIQPDGKIVGAGFIRTPGSGITNVAVTRYNPDKTIDVQFGRGGVNTVSWGPGSSSIHRANALLIQPSGRIIVGGAARFQNMEFGLARFNAHGFLDVGFGNSGKVITQFGTDDEEIFGLAQQSDGKIVAAGHYYSAFLQTEYAIARYDGSGSNTFASRALYDYDGDGRSDVSVYRPSSSTWYIFNSLTSTVNIRTFGNVGDRPAPADYDGDGKTEMAIYRPTNGAWWWLSSLTGAATPYVFGITGDAPRPGDYTGDGRADIVNYQNHGVWNRSDVAGSQGSDVVFGQTGDLPLLGDFDGDAKADPAIYRPSTGDWWYAASSAGGQHRAVHWGISTDIPVPGDYDGDFKTDFAVYRPSEGRWYIYNSSNGSFTIQNFGLSEDRPVAADYDGDGRADIAVFRPSTGVWYLLQSTGGFLAIQWGVSTDIPTPNAFVP